MLASAAFRIGTAARGVMLPSFFVPVCMILQLATIDPARPTTFHTCHCWTCHIPRRILHSALYTLLSTLRTLHPTVCDEFNFSEHKMVSLDMLTSTQAAQRYRWYLDPSESTWPLNGPTIYDFAEWHMPWSHSSRRTHSYRAFAPDRNIACLVTSQGETRKRHSTSSGAAHPE